MTKLIVGLESLRNATIQLQRGGLWELGESTPERNLKVGAIQIKKMSLPGEGRLTREHFCSFRRKVVTFHPRPHIPTMMSLLPRPLNAFLGLTGGPSSTFPRATTPLRRRENEEIDVKEDKSY